MLKLAKCFYPASICEEFLCLVKSCALTIYGNAGNEINKKRSSIQLKTFYFTSENKEYLPNYRGIDNARNGRRAIARVAIITMYVLDPQI